MSEGSRREDLGADPPTAGGGLSGSGAEPGDLEPGWGVGSAGGSGGIAGGPRWGPSRGGGVSGRPMRVQRPGEAARRLGVVHITLGWCLWLIGTLVVTRAAVSVAPASRLMVMSALLGLTAVWPAVRLSQGPAGLGATLAARVAWLDWVCLMAVLQVVIWPMRLLAGWSLGQVAWVAAALGAWSLLTAALLGWGLKLGGAGRAWVMGAILAVLIGEPAVVAVLGPGWMDGWRMHVSPIQAVWALTRPPAGFTADPWWAHVAAAGGAAALAWGVVVLGTLRSR